MDIGSVRPVIPGMNAPVPRAPAAAEQAASTDLPVGSAVARTEETARVGNDPRGGETWGSCFYHWEFPAVRLRCQACRPLISRAGVPAMSVRSLQFAIGRAHVGFHHLRVV